MLFVLFLVMTIFAGGRSADVGTDSGNYAKYFEESRFKGKEIGAGLEALTDEPGFYYLEKSLSSLSSEYYVLFMGIASLFCFFVLLSISRNSVKPILSLFVFITLGYYTFVFNAARQGLAMAIFMAAIPYLIRNRFLPYLLIIFCAAMFHKTIVVAIPLFFIVRMKFSWKSLAILIAGGFLVGYLLPAFLSYSSTLEDRYMLYNEGGETGGYMLTLFYVILTVFFILQRQYINEEILGRYDIYLHMLVVGTAIYLIVAIMGAYVEVNRFAAYFQFSSIFLWPLLLKYRKKPLNKAIFYVALIGHLGFFALFLSKMSNLTPYLWNPNL